MLVDLDQVLHVLVVSGDVEADVIADLPLHPDLVGRGALRLEVGIAERNEVAAGVELVLEEPVGRIQVLKVRLLEELSVVEAQQRLLVEREQDAEPRRDPRVHPVGPQVLGVERIGVRPLLERTQIVPQRRGRGIDVVVAQPGVDHDALALELVLRVERPHLRVLGPVLRVVAVLDDLDPASPRRWSRSRRPGRSRNRPSCCRTRSCPAGWSAGSSGDTAACGAGSPRPP